MAVLLERKKLHVLVHVQNLVSHIGKDIKNVHAGTEVRKKRKQER